MDANRVAASLRELRQVDHVRVRIVIVLGFCDLHEIIITCRIAHLNFRRVPAVAQDLDKAGVAARRKSEFVGAPQGCPVSAFPSAP